MTTDLQGMDASLDLFETPGQKKEIQIKELDFIKK